MECELCVRTFGEKCNMENPWVVPLTATGVALMGMFAIAWRSRARALARRLAALNSYAERELTRERRRKALKAAQSFSTMLRVPGKVRSPAAAVAREKV
jgi:hypothetical protein